MTVTLHVCQLSRFQISCILVTIMLMLMHEGSGTMKCGSTTCRNYVMAVGFSKTIQTIVTKILF